MRDFYAEIGAFLGTSYAIIPIGDPRHENAAHTTVTTVGGPVAGNGLVFTYSEARPDFDEATVFVRNQQRVPLWVPFNGSDEELDTPDDDFWSVDDSGDQGFSVGAWIWPDGIANETIFAKRVNVGANAEYLFHVEQEGKIGLALRDANASVNAQTIMDAAFAPSTKFRQFVVVTYDGRAGADAADGLKTYVGGALVATTATNNVNYVSMVNGAITPTVAMRSGATSLYDGKIGGGPTGLFFMKHTAAGILTAQNIADIYQVGLEAQRAGPGLLIPRRKLVKV